MENIQDTSSGKMSPAHSAAKRDKICLVWHCQGKYGGLKRHQF